MRKEQKSLIRNHRVGTQDRNKGTSRKDFDKRNKDDRENMCEQIKQVWSFWPIRCLVYAVAWEIPLGSIIGPCCDLYGVKYIYITTNCDYLLGHAVIFMEWNSNKLELIKLFLQVKAGRQIMTLNFIQLYLFCCLP